MLLGILLPDKNAGLKESNIKTFKNLFLLLKIFFF